MAVEDAWGSYTRSFNPEYSTGGVGGLVQEKGKELLLILLCVHAEEIQGQARELKKTQPTNQPPKPPQTKPACIYILLPSRHFDFLKQIHLPHV